MKLEPKIRPLGNVWIVCGGRAFHDSFFFIRAMDQIVKARGMPDKVVHGAAKGADTLADKRARRNQCTTIPVPTNWDEPNAGPKRNEKMIVHHAPRLVVAFPGGAGTANMLALAERYRIERAVVQPKETGDPLCSAIRVCFFS